MKDLLGRAAEESQPFFSGPPELPMPEHPQRHVYLAARTLAVHEAVHDALGDCTALRCFNSIAGCRRVLSEQPCDILLVDVADMAESALLLIEESAEMYPLLARIAIVKHGDIRTAIQAIRSGVADCLEKPVEREAVSQVVMPVLQPQWPVDHGDHARLTPVEQAVLARVLQGLTSRQIADLLHRSPRTVEAHRRSIMRKLRAKNLADLVIQLSSGRSVFRLHSPPEVATAHSQPQP